MPPPPPTLLLEHAGITVSAVGGVLAARGRRIDLFGVLVLALVTAFGGGTVRDLLVGDTPVAWLRSPGYLLNATVTAIIAFALVGRRPLPRLTLLLADAGALALFTLMGTEKGIALEFSAPVAVLLGVVTGVAGGILRDVLTGEVPLVFRPEIRLYATAALCGALVYVLTLRAGLRESVAAGIGGLVVLGLRLAGIRWDLALPVLREP